MTSKDAQEKPRITMCSEWIQNQAFATQNQTNDFFFSELSHVHSIWPFCNPSMQVSDCSNLCSFPYNFNFLILLKVLLAMLRHCRTVNEVKIIKTSN